MQEVGFIPRCLASYYPGIFNEGVPRAPMHTWLETSQSDEDKARLKMMGNCVVPSMATLAMDIFQMYENVKTRGNCL